MGSSPVNTKTLDISYDDHLTIQLDLHDHPISRGEELTKQRLHLRRYRDEEAVAEEDEDRTEMGLAYNVYLNSNKIYGCRQCKTHLSVPEEIVSRVSLPHNLSSPATNAPTNIPDQNFRGQHGKAYLFSSVVNIVLGEPGERNMTTGRHVVRDISCRQCKEVVGWRYDKAYETTEKYKEGKFILEAECLCNVT
jgi:hypothetical protein